MADEPVEAVDFEWQANGSRHHFPGLGDEQLHKQRGVGPLFLLGLIATISQKGTLDAD